MKHSFAQQSSAVVAPAIKDACTAHLHPAAGVVCPGCGARVGKPCVSTVPLCGVGSVGSPIDGIHSERIAAALERGLA